jgi:cytochrome c biogenesis protein CcmG/thiol:disulfide interchange protein DsbE
MSRGGATKRRPPPVTKDRQSRRTLVTVLAVVIVGAFLVAWAMAGGERVAMPDNPSVAITGTALAEFTGSGADPAIGSPAPELTGINFRGDEVKIADDGRPKLVLFLAHWCPHCRNEVPALQAYINSTGLPATADLYSVATMYSPSQPNWPPSAWLTSEGWTPPVLVDDAASSAYRAFGSGPFPYYVFLDAQGEVVLRLSGERGAETIAGLMEQLGAGELVPPPS